MKDRHARIHRAHVRAWLCAGALGAVSLSADAFVSPSPPPGFGGTPGNWTFSPPSPTDQLGKIMRGPGPSIAGAGETSAAYRLGGGAARALAKGVLRGGPWLGLALGIAWLAEHCFEQQSGTWVRTCGGDAPTPSTGLEFSFGLEVSGFQSAYGWFSTAAAACALLPAHLKSIGYSNSQQFSYATIDANGFACRVYRSDGAGLLEFNVTSRASNCPAGWYVTPAGCIQSPPPQTVTEQEIEDEMAQKPLPQKLPPGFPYPLDPTSPSIWNPDEADPPNSRPLRVPQGNPVPVPNTDPQQYRQPVTRYTSSPTAADPWRMDIQPEDVISESPTGQTGPETLTSGSPGGEDREGDLCENNPDILACQKLDLDTPDGEIPREERQLEFKEESFFGGGACPASQSVNTRILGTVTPWNWAAACEHLLITRALVMVLATFAAFLIVLPGKEVRT